MHSHHKQALFCYFNCICLNIVTVQSAIYYLSFFTWQGIGSGEEYFQNAAGSQSAIFVVNERTFGLWMEGIKRNIWGWSPSSHIASNLCNCCWFIFHLFSLYTVTHFQSFQSKLAILFFISGFFPPPFSLHKSFSVVLLSFIIFYFYIIL